MALEGFSPCHGKNNDCILYFLAQSNSYLLCQHRPTETHNHTYTPTEDNVIARVLMDDGVDSGVQWPAGSQRPKDRGGKGGKME